MNADGIIGANEDILGYNLYAYVSNNWINSNDEDGSFAVALPWIGPVIPVVIEAAKYVAIAAAVSLMGVGSKVEVKERVKAVEEKKSTITRDTLLYRYGETNPSNLTPKQKDAKTGLSFSLLPPLSGRDAAVTTVGALESTGLLNVIQDKPYHVSVTSKYDTLQNWINIGTNHPCTQAVKSVVIKWDGVLK